MERDEGAEICGNCTGKGQINYVREFAPNALESNKPATEAFLYLNGGDKFDFCKGL